MMDRWRGWIAGGAGTALSTTAMAQERANAGAGLHDLSPWSMFMSADAVVKSVMVGLALASLVTWTVFIAKNIELIRARRRLSGDLARVEEARGVPEAQLLCGRDGALSRFLHAASREIEASHGFDSPKGVMDRALSRFSDITRSEQRAARRGMGALATIGSTAPFVGLFGTVWGIMNSFIGISKSQTTNLAVVAPGIAEALLATALGLVAAIPAVVIYNYFTRATGAYLDLLHQAASAAARLVSRDMDMAPHRASPSHLARAAE